MKSVFRPTTVEDLDAIRQFLQRVFDADPNAPFMDPAAMRWKYWDPRPDWPEPRAYVLERDGVITAHAGVWPMMVGDVRGIEMIDWASAPEAPGAGLLILQKLTGLFDFVYSIGGTDMTKQILPKYGFREQSQQWKGARPIRPLQQVMTHQRKDWKLAPRLVRNTVWSAFPSVSPPAGWKSSETTPAEVFHSPYASPRPLAFFQYLQRCPAASVRFYSLQNSQGPAGNFVLSVIRGQARLAGLWLRETNAETRQAAYVLAQNAASEIDGVNEFVTTGSGENSRDAASRAGLQISREWTPIFLLDKKGKWAIDPDFQFQLIDDDGFFLSANQPEYWT